MKRLVVLIMLILVGKYAKTQICDTSLWVPNGDVNAILLKDSLLYVGGTFTQVSPVVGHFVAVDSLTGIVVPPFPFVNGRINCMAKDSVGRIYVGGSFNQVGNYSCENLFRLTAQGLFDPTFIVNPDAEVYTLYVYTNNLYVGGDFQYVSGYPRLRGAAFHVTDSIQDTIRSYYFPGSDSLTDFDAQSNGPIYSYCADRQNQQLITGGDFNNIGGGAIAYICKLDVITGNYIPAANSYWTAFPQVGGPVRSIGVIGTKIFLAGDFSSFANIQPGYLGVINLTNGFLQPDNANINGPVRVLKILNNKIYIGGNFSIVAGNFRNNLACLDSNFILQSWNPSTNGPVYDIECWDSTAFCVGGNFKMIGSDTCYYAGIVDTSGVVHPINSMFDGVVYAVMPANTNGKFWAGGSFTGANGIFRDNLCAININTKRPNNWHPKLNNTVMTLYADTTQLFVAGNFSTVNSQARGRLASFDLATNTLTNFNPIINGLVRTMVEDNAGLFIGGNFSTIGSTTRNNIGCVNVATSQATIWNPGCTGTVNKIILDGDHVYVAGFYTQIGGRNRQNLARVSASTALADFGWSCDTDDGIYDMDLYNGNIFIGGWFLNVVGQPRNYFAQVDTTSGNLLGLNPGFDDYIRTFVRWNDDFFISGPFINVAGNVTRPHLSNYDFGDAQFDSWIPSPNDFPETMQVSQNWLYVGGSFSTVGSKFHPKLAMLSVNYVTGISQNENSLVNQLIVWPNPSSDFVYLSFSNSNQVLAGKKILNIKVFNMNGQCVIEQIENSDNQIFKIDFSKLASGMYFVRVEDANGNIFNEKVIRN